MIETYPSDVIESFGHNQNGVIIFSFDGKTPKEFGRIVFEHPDRDVAAALIEMHADELILLSRRMTDPSADGYFDLCLSEFEIDGNKVQWRAQRTQYPRIATFDVVREGFDDLRSFAGFKK